MLNRNIDESSKKNIVLSVIARILNVSVGIVSVNIYLLYLGNKQYGLWMTVFSIASWVSMGDLGIGQGLRNELAKAYAENNEKKQQELVSTAFFMLLKISFVIYIFLTILCETLICLDIIDNSIRLPIHITNFFMCVVFVFGVFDSVTHSYQLSYISIFTQFFIGILNLIIILLLLLCNVPSNLVIFALIYGFSNIFVYYIYMHVVLKKIGFGIKAKKINSSYNESIISLGIMFFLLQICGLILYSTDNVIINKIFGSEEVTRYSIITKVYNTGDMLFSIFLISLWSAVTYQFSLNNIQWIRDKIKHLLKIWLLYIMGIVVVAVFFNDIVKIWLGSNSVCYSKDIILIFSLYSAFCMFGAIFVNVANGMSLVKYQLVIAIIEAFLNIPLSIFLAINCNMGIAGVKLATLICCFGSNVVTPIYITYYLSRINNKR